MIEAFPDFKHIQIAVLGDLMLDRYWHGQTSRISPEAPVQVVNIGNIEDRPGGAANVALNIAHLGGKVTLFGVCGKDDVAGSLESQLNTNQVDCAFQKKPRLDTITKIRIISRKQQLIRLDFEASEKPSNYAYDDFNRLENTLANTDVIILSDYAKGTLTHVKEIIALANAHGIATFVDPKGDDFSIYHGATLVKPNMYEFENIVGPVADEKELEEKGQALREKYQWQALLVTRGEAGMTLIEEGGITHHKARTKEVYDVTGAGDTVIATLASAISAGLTIKQAMHLASAAAGLVVAKMGTASVSHFELNQAVMQPHADHRALFDQKQLQAELKRVRQESERIVFTNGCFDILHPGHITYLEKAKSLGDKLIIGINDDDSVKRLKGPSRPVNTLDNRMTMLSALHMVDWVVPFSEDTPLNLIKNIQPDVLVKGGDYKIEDIVGAKFVESAGGEIQVIDFLDGHSTSNLIKHIKKASK